MKYAFILTREVAFPVAVMCAVLGVSRSGYYGWKKSPVSKRQERDAAKMKDIEAAFVASRGTYGSPRVHAELKAIGKPDSERKVAELMRSRGLVARKKKRFRATTDSKHNDPIADNLVARELTSTAKNATWVTDVTAIWTLSGWLFLAALIDLFSRRVVGWATSSTNDRFLALDCLRDAIQRRAPGPGLVHHSDRGSPYASGDYIAELERFGMVRSMSRKGDCWDNAVAESFFSTLKTELIGESIPRSFDAASAAIGEYIEVFYNARRRHSSNGYVSPMRGPDVGKRRRRGAAQVPAGGAWKLLRARAAPRASARGSTTRAARASRRARLASGELFPPLDPDGHGHESAQVMSDSSLELVAAEGALVFRVSDSAHAGSEWCQVYLRADGEERPLGADVLREVVRRIFAVLVEEPAQPRWMFSLSERHHSAYGQWRPGGWILRVQNADAVFIAQITLSPEERTRWLEQLAAFQSRGSERKEVAQ